MTTKEIEFHAMRDRGLNAVGSALVALFNRRTRGLLYHYHERRMVRAVPGNEEGRRRAAGSIGGN